MLHTVTLPKVGDTVDEVVIIEWLVQVGDIVAAGDSLVRVETSKVELDIESPVTGRLRKRVVDVDDEISTGADLALIELIPLETQ